MPSTYAHYRLGQEVLKNLPAKEKRLIEQHKELFDIGLHGPDILFYYNPLYPCRINKQGYNMHAKSARLFFEKAADELEYLNERDTQAALAYIYGFCCHFALDVCCHGYIDEKIAIDGVSHAEIEVEFDRKLMIEDGYNPLTHSLTDHIHPLMENARIICKFFNYLAPEDVEKALQSMISYNKLLIAPSHIKRGLIYALLAITGNYKEMHGLLVNYKANPRCMDSTQRLHEYYASAVKMAQTLIVEFRDSAEGELPFNRIYDYTFGAQKICETCVNERDIYMITRERRMV